MSNTLRTAAVGAALLAGTAAASAQTIIVPDPNYDVPPPVVYEAPPVAAPEIVVPAPAPGVVVAPPVATETIVEPAPQRVIRPRPRTTEVRLTTRERHAVLRTIRHERPARAVTERVSYRVGTILPASVPIYAMPRQVIYEAPALRGYDYTLVGDRMLVVEPGTNTVVDEIY
jgi:hypothetical protein